LRAATPFFTARILGRHIRNPDNYTSSISGYPNARLEVAPRILTLPVITDRVGDVLRQGQLRRAECRAWNLSPQS
jgi:hypothetical protein